MTDFNQFGSAKPSQTGDAKHCSQCEAMLADALDETLSAEDQAFFDLHMAGCSTCSGMLADARRGAAWLEMLRSPRPEPTADLLERILLQTSGLAPHNADNSVPAIKPIGVSSPNTLFSYTGPASPARPAAASNILPFRSRFGNIGHTLLQPRLAMTAAMAFFSVALTLNLTGVHLSEIRASDVKPSALRRGFYDANAHVVRYFDNLRVVYELESRVHDLQQSPDEDTSSISQPAPQEQQQSAPSNPDNPKNAPADKPKQPRPKSGSGSSRREDLRENRLYLFAASPEYGLPSAHGRFTLVPVISMKEKQEGERA